MKLWYNGEIFRNIDTLIGQSLSTFFISLAMLAMVDAIPADARQPDFACGEATCLLTSIASSDGFDSLTGPQLPQKQFGIYLNSGSTAMEDFMEETMERLESSGVPAFVFDVKDYHVYFASDSELANTMGSVASLYDLPSLVSAAKERGFYTIARYSAIRDPSLARRSPQSRMVHPLTGEALGDEWVDPANEEVFEYNREILREVVASGVDEVNLDYLRYPTEFPSALSHISPGEKARRIEDFLTMARGIINASGHETKLGISTFAILGWNSSGNLSSIGQDVVRFAPLVDVISPMAYPAQFSENAYYDSELHHGSRMYYLVKRTLDGYAEVLGKEHAWKLRPWIQGYVVTPEDMRDQIQAVYDSGSCGFTIWSQGNFYSAFYEALPGIGVPKRCEV